VKDRLGKLGTVVAGMVGDCETGIAVVAGMVVAMIVVGATVVATTVVSGMLAGKSVSV